MKSFNPNQKTGNNGNIMTDDQADQFLVSKNGIVSGLFGLNADGLAVLQTTSGTVDVRYATDDEMTFNSLRDTFKIVQTDTVTVSGVAIDTTPGGTASSETTVGYDVNLGTPVIFAFVNNEATQSKKQANLAVDDSAIGTVTWDNPGYLAPESGNGASATLGTAYNTGFLHPASTGATKNDWTNPANVYASDNTYATATPGASDKYQDYYNFNFSIPSNAIIIGMEVQVEGHDIPTTAGVGVNIEVNVGGGSPISMSFGATQSLNHVTDTVLTFGSSYISSIDPKPTASQINDNTSAGIRIVPRMTKQGGGTDPTGYIDDLTVKIYYTKDDISDTSIVIRKSDATYGSTDKATSTSLNRTGDITTYGGSSDLWDETWTPDDINSAEFGIGLSYTGSFSGDVSHYLLVNDYGFAIPLTATIVGIQASLLVYQSSDWANFPGVPAVVIAQARMSVFYTIDGQTQQWDSTKIFYQDGISASLLPLGQLTKSIIAVDGVMTLRSEILYSAVSNGLLTFGPWDVRYYILQETAI